MDSSTYDFELPRELIALRPAVPRDSSRLLVYQTKTDKLDLVTFRDIVQFLPEKSALVLNNTRVIPARATLFKNTGGRVTCLFLMNEMGVGQDVSCLMDRKVMVGAELSSHDGRIKMKVTSQKEKLFTVRVKGGRSHLEDYLAYAGAMPIPPYLRSSTLSSSDLKIKYQTVFSQKPGSVAAPTASLHFTNRVFKSIDQKKVKRLYVTLQVGMGTFAPLTPEHLQTNTLHTEWYHIPTQTKKEIKQMKEGGRSVVAVGTTVARSLESYALNEESASGFFPTSLFIHKPYSFRILDGLLTNFHLPGSSLMMLVDAFLDYKKASMNIRDLYAIAVGARMRFYSFGDAMLVL